ncbi:MAG: tetratricopeptide repeat protein, partial [Acidobacteriota bacterium]
MKRFVLSLAVLCVSFSSAAASDVFRPPAPQDAATSLAVSRASELEGFLYNQLLKEKKRGNYDAVISECHRILKRDGRHYRASRLLVEAAEEKGRVSSSREDLYAALDFIETSLSANQSPAHRFYGLGIAYKKLKDFPQARRYLRMGISSGARFWDVYEELLTCYETKSDIEDNGVFFGGQFRLQPDNPFLHQAQGITLLFGSSYKEALGALETALRLHRRNGDKLAESQCLAWMSYAGM